MKKVKGILVLTVMLLVTQSASAQLSLGVVGGLNSSNFKVAVDQPIAVPLPTGGTVPGSFSSRTGLVIGGVSEYYFSPMVGLSVQPMYSKHGSKFVFEGPVVALKDSVKSTNSSWSIGGGLNLPCHRKDGLH